MRKNDMGAHYIRDLLKAKPYLATRNPFDEEEPGYCTKIWKDTKGRYCKRQLSKARRRQWRAEVRGESHPRSSAYWESECNWKGW